jgi:predicted O-methyltransferase YrrM
MTNHPHQEPHLTYWTDGSDLPVWQFPGEFDQLLSLFESKQPKRVLEVGTYYGGTLKQWLQRSQPGTLVVSVDRYDIPRADNRAHYSEWAAPGVEYAVIVGDSHNPATIASAAANGPYDFILIDADHVYDAAKRDWENYGSMCAEGGVIVFHDIVSCPIAHPELQVNRLWAEIKAVEATFEYVNDPAQTCCGIGVVVR